MKGEQVRTQLILSTLDRYLLEQMSKRSAGASWSSLCRLAIREKAYQMGIQIPSDAELRKFEESDE